MIASDSKWDNPPAHIRPADGEVHVWRAHLHWAASQLSSLQQTLSSDELQRAGRFQFERDRLNFVVSRGVLRNILAYYLGVKPGEITFKYSPYGKPALAFTNATLSFNMSHSSGLALYAITRGGRVGVDVEYVKPGLPTDGLAQKFFTPGETATLLALPPAVRHEAFFTYWTYKEAYLKARGEGVAMGLKGLDVSSSTGARGALVSNTNDQAEVERWTSWEVTPGAGYKAAVVVEGDCYHLRCWQWTVDLVHRAQVAAND
ncbi:MAG: 4-phosphopantetheinyl transferase [Chloroflexia bacterium]|jgi:4'-phosphopantetheinyl transferase|nr:4-phosphopantetheinyl transferase [Chloroflexia bacterium]